MTRLALAVAVAGSLCLAHVHASADGDQCGWGYPRDPVRQQPMCLDEHASTDDPASWAPWTHRPHCIEAADEPWCVFTNAAVGGADGNGMSIITTPELAAGALGLLTRPAALAEAAERYIPAEQRLDRPPPYAVREVPGKGQGAVATRPIPSDRVILIDTAVLLSTVEYPADVLQSEVQDLMRTGVGRLRDPARVYALARRGDERSGGGGGGGGDDGDEEGEEERMKLSVEEDIVLTNAFELTVDDKSYMGLFENLARINHACNPK